MLLALCEGNPPVTGEFPSQTPVTWSFDIFFDLHLNKQLRKSLTCQWFEMPSRSLWHHCNVSLTCLVSHRSHSPPRYFDRISALLPTPLRPQWTSYNPGTRFHHSTDSRLIKTINKKIVFHHLLKLTIFRKYARFYHLFLFLELSKCYVSMSLCNR